MIKKIEQEVTEATENESVVKFQELTKRIN